MNTVIQNKGVFFNCANRVKQTLSFRVCVFKFNGVLSHKNRKKLAKTMEG